MSDVLAFVPLAAQAIYTVSSAPRLHALLRAKRSDQHSAAYHAMVLLAHVMMAAWALGYAEQEGLALAYGVAVLTAAAPLGLVLYYARWPGGRA